MRHGLPLPLRIMPWHVPSRAWLAVILLPAVLALAACERKVPPIAPPPPGDGLADGGGYKIGSPYTIGGETYYPAEDWDYDKVGIASWYGPNFHGKTTANGERFDQNAVTAAHKTLPIPSLVEVENLSNKRRLVVRVNDRGPFVGDRIIDLSRRAAQLLGFERLGTTEVRVRILEEESKVLKRIALGELDESAAPKLTRVAYESEVINSEGEALIEDSSDTALAFEEIEEGGLVDGEADGEDTHGQVLVVEPEPEVATEINEDEITTIVPQRRLPVEEPIVEAAGGTEVLIDIEEPQAPLGVQLFIQVGSFIKEGNAHKLAADLSEFGVAQIQSATVGQKLYYRVRLGPFPNRFAREELAARLINAGYGDIRLLEREGP